MLLIHINFRWLNCFLIRYPYRYQFYESTRFGIVAGLRGGREHDTRGAAGTTLALQSA